MENVKQLGEIADCVCGNCGGRDWQVQFGHYKDGKRTLIISCANETCQEQRREELHGKPTDTVIWAEYDISHQSGDICDVSPTLQDIGIELAN